MRYLLIFVLIFFVSYNSYTQTDIMSNAGKDFVIIFPKNENSIESPSDLWIYITNKDNLTNNVSVTYNLDNQDTILNYIISNDEVISVKIPSELELSDNLNNEKKTVRIKSDSDIVVYCLTKNEYTSDAYLAYPIATYGNEYIIPSWFNSMPDNVIGSNLNRFSTCAIASIEDDTEITLIPLDPIHIAGGHTKHAYSFSMNKLETRIIQASHLAYHDLTGLIIKSNKPIAVFSGHEKATIPKNYINRNVLIEQIIPLIYLGTNGLVTPIKIKKSGYEIANVRVIAYFDRTTVLINNRKVLLNSQEFYHFQSAQPVFIHSDKSILIAQYAESQHSQVSSGDQFLAVHAPTEQYLNNYTFISVPFEEFTEHWVNVTIKKGGENSLKINDDFIDKSRYGEIDGTDYLFKRIRLEAGVHRIKSDSIFGILVYGFGPTISYGYTGGMKTERLLEKIMDSNIPQMIEHEECDAELEITENNKYDSGIDDIKILNSVNVSVNINPFQKGEKSVKINLELIDKNDDGFTVFETMDVKGYRRLDTINLYGFRISSDYQTFNDSINYLGFRCDTIRLMNNGRVASTFNLYFNENTKISVPPSYSRITLNSGQDTLIPYCIYADNHNEISDILILEDDCDREENFNMTYTIQSISADVNSKCDLELVIVTDLGSFIRSNDYENNAVMKIYSLSGNELYNGTPNEFTEFLNRGVYFILIFENSELKSRFIVNAD